MRTSFIDMFRHLGVDPPEALARYTMRLMYGADLAGAEKALRDYAGRQIDQALEDLKREMGDSGTWDLPRTDITEIAIPKNDL